MISCHPRITNLGLPVIHGIGWGAKLAVTGPSPHAKQLTGMDVSAAASTINDRFPHSLCQILRSLSVFNARWMSDASHNFPFSPLHVLNYMLWLLLAYSYERKESLEMNLCHWVVRFADCGFFLG